MRLADWQGAAYVLSTATGKREMVADLGHLWAAAERLTRETAARRERLWRQFETQVRGPFVLGDRPGALDLYLGVMGWWQPGRAWFARETPKVAGVVEAVRAVPALAGVFARHRETLAVDAAGVEG